MSRHEIGPPAALLQDAESCGGNGQESGLRIGGEFEIFLAAFEAEAGEIETERVVRLIEDASRCRKFIGQGFAHAGELRALAGE